MALVPPTILTSILPFGIVTKNKEKYARFSLCIDLKSVYGDDQPNGNALFDFFKSYGLEKESIYDKLTKDNQVRFELEGATKPLSGTLSFRGPKEFAAFNNISGYWHELLKDETNSTNSIRAASIGNQELFKNPVVGLPITTILNPTMPDLTTVIAKAVASFHELQSPIQAMSSSSVSSLPDEMTRTVQPLDKFVVEMNNKLDGISDFAMTQNRQQSFSLLSALSGSGVHDLSTYSVVRIMDTFSFINSNVLLQRLFGTTIDFELKLNTLIDALAGKTTFTIKLHPDSYRTLPTNVDWQHLKTAMTILGDDKVGKQIYVEPRAQPRPVYKAENYDKGSKLKSLSQLNERIDNYKAKLNAAKTESERYTIIKEIIKIDSAAFTRGMNVYTINMQEIINAQQDNGNLVNNDVIHMQDITRGYRFGVNRKSGNRLYVGPLGKRSVSIKNVPLPDEFRVQHFAVSTDAGMHALVENDQHDIQEGLLVDSVILTWSGENVGMPSVFSNQEDEKNFEANLDEGSIENSSNLVIQAFEKIVVEEYLPKAVIYAKGNENPEMLEAAENAKKRIHITYSGIENQRLILGRNYELTLTPEYKNGWAIPSEQGSGAGLLNFPVGHSHRVTIPVFKFKRNEPVSPVVFFQQEQLLTLHEDGINRSPVENREGESLYHLVIRNFSKSEHKEYATTQKSIRHILPPAISFEHAFWHGKIFAMDSNESYKWYMKYHYPNDKNVTYGSIKMQDFYPDDCAINYLSDPLCKGFRLEFFLDKAGMVKAQQYEQYEQNEYYFSGDYPYIKAWKLIVEDIELNENLLTKAWKTIFEEAEPSEKLVTAEDDIIHIRVERGMELFVTVRTLIDESYEDQFETYGNYNDFTKYGGNDLLTPPRQFSIVHAMQRPLVTPLLNNTLLAYKEQNNSVLQLTASLTMEQLGIRKDIAGILNYSEDIRPTGDVELFAKWQNYSDDPLNVVGPADEWTPQQPVNSVDLTQFETGYLDNSPATFEVNVPFSDEQIGRMQTSLTRTGHDRNEYKNYAADIRVEYDVNETKYIEKYYWVVNRSRFSSYYSKPVIKTENKNPDYNHHFGKRSTAPFVVKLLNSKKPAAPKLASRAVNLVSVNEEITVENGVSRKASLNRLRFYFERGRLTSGKGERIGFVVNEPKNKYNDLFVKNQLISVVGKDILSDRVMPFDGLFRNEDVLLQRSNFVTHDPYDLSNEAGDKVTDLEGFYPEYVEELGLMTYLPKFDKKLNLWFLEVELDINTNLGNELHSPFLQFALVNYQANSFDYNPKNVVPDVSKDCRLSEIIKSGYVYIMASRLINVEFGREHALINVTVDSSSLKANGKSKFYACIEQREKGGIKWEVADREKEKDKASFLKLTTEIPNRLEYFKKTNHAYRLVVLETEDWTNNRDTSLASILNNKQSRVVLVSVFDL